jgi:hypothetical protein
MKARHVIAALGCPTSETTAPPAPARPSSIPETALRALRGFVEGLGEQLSAHAPQSEYVAYAKEPWRLNGELERLPAENDPDGDLCTFKVVAVSFDAASGRMRHGHSRVDQSPTVAISSEHP